MTKAEFIAVQTINGGMLVGTVVSIDGRLRLKCVIPSGLINDLRLLQIETDIKNGKETSDGR